MRRRLAKRLEEKPVLEFEESGKERISKTREELVRGKAVVLETALLILMYLNASMRGTRRCRFNPWVWKILWRREWHPMPVFLPGESQGQRNLAGCSPRGLKESGTTERRSRRAVCSVAAQGQVSVCGVAESQTRLSN